MNKQLDAIEIAIDQEIKEKIANVSITAIEAIINEFPDVHEIHGSKAFESDALNLFGAPKTDKPRRSFIKEQLKRSNEMLMDAIRGYEDLREKGFSVIEKNIMLNSSNYLETLREQLERHKSKISIYLSKTRILDDAKREIEKHDYEGYEPKIRRGIPHLPLDMNGIVECARNALLGFDKAVCDNDRDAARRYEDIYLAAEWSLYGGDRHDPDKEKLHKRLSEVSGRVCKWGQHGEFLLTVKGMRVWVSSSSWSFSSPAYSYRAVDAGMPFISETGFRSDLGGLGWGLTVEEHITQRIEFFQMEELAKRGKGKKSKSPTLAPATLNEVPDWLQDLKQ